MTVYKNYRIGNCFSSFFEFFVLQTRFPIEFKVGGFLKDVRGYVS